MVGNNLLHGAAQRVFGGPLSDLQSVGDCLRHGKHFPIQEWNTQFQGVGHGHLIGLDQNVAPHPREQVQVLHPGNRVHVAGIRVDGSSDIAVVPFRFRSGHDALELLPAEGARVAVVAFFHGGGAALEQGLALHTVGQHGAELAESFE